MTAPSARNVRLRGPDELIAAVPHLLGFHPADSLVLVALTAGRIELTLRVDLVPGSQADLLAVQLVEPVCRQRPSGVVLVVFGGHGPDAPNSPGAAAVEALTIALAGRGIPVLHAAWARASERGAPWRCYDEPGCGGTLPDPTASPLGAATVAAGLVTFGDRAELTRLLAPDPPAVLARRRTALDRAARPRLPGGDGKRIRGALHTVQDAVRAADRDELVLDDAAVVRLAGALADRWVRDACLPLCAGGTAEGAGRLWLALTRGTPEPERAEPACLFAITSYLRGEGALAGMALEAALLADPGHRLAALLQAALAAGIPPSRMREVARAAAAEARAQLGAAVVSPRRGRE